MKIGDRVEITYLDSCDEGYFKVGEQGKLLDYDHTEGLWLMLFDGGKRHFSIDPRQAMIIRECEDIKA